MRLGHSTTTASQSRHGHGTGRTWQDIRSWDGDNKLDNDNDDDDDQDDDAGGDEPDDSDSVGILSRWLSV